MDRRTKVAIRAEGAELYVRAFLMLELGIPTSLASRNMPGYDLIAHNVESHRNCRIQVKYRTAINSDGARVKSFDFDFMVYVAGNVGRIGSKVPFKEAESKPTEFFVLPRELVKQNTTSDYALFRSPTRGGYEEYRNGWHLIREFLFPSDVTTPQSNDSVL